MAAGAGRSRLEAQIRLEHRSPADVPWSLEAHFLASGARCRRVKQADRPSMEVRLSFFEPDVRDWTELEREKPGTGEREEMPEWPTTVFFRTEPGTPAPTARAAEEMSG